MFAHGRSLLLVLVITIPGFGAKQVTFVAAHPSFVVAGTPTTVMFEATIASDPDLLRSSVKLIRLGSDGRPISVDTTLVDDGTSGDRVQNDNVFTGLLSINQGFPETRRYIVSAGYRNTLFRTTSGPVVLMINNPSFSSAPDPKQIVVDSLGTHPANELLVRLTNGTGPVVAGSLAAQIGATVVGFSPMINTYQLRLTASSAHNLSTVITQLETSTFVLGAVPNYVVPVSSVTNDMTALQIASPSAVAAYAKIDVFDAWNSLSPAFFSFNPVVIGIVDGGFDRSHQEFHNVDFGASPASSFSTATSDPVKHGTSVAGIIGANNVSAFAAPGVGQMNGIVAGITSSATAAGSAIPYTLEVRRFSTLATLFDGMHTQNQALVRVTNMSFGYYRQSAIPSNLWSDPRIKNHMVSDAMFTKVTEWFSDLFDVNNGTLFVISAGNYPFGVDNSCPANAAPKANVMAIAATDLSDARAKWNSVEESTYGAGIAIAAPGVSVYAPEPTNAYTADFSGTSAAAPLVTGTTALLFGLNGVLSPEAVKNYVIAGGESIVDQSISGKRLNTWQTVEQVLLDYPIESGRVQIKATLNGQDWPTSGQGNLTAAVLCPFRNITTNLVPTGTAYVPVGQCTVTFGGGGPASSTFVGIDLCQKVSPPGVSCLHNLHAGQTLTFTIQFTSNPPTAGFLMSSGSQFKSEGQSMSLTVPTGGMANVNFDATTRSSAVNGATITGWQWSINNVAVASSSTLVHGFAVGTYAVSLVVTDSRGSQSQPVKGTINVTASGSTNSMNLPRFSHTATLLNDGRVLVTGGTIAGGMGTNTDTNTAELYDPQAGTWRYTGIGTQTSMVFPRREHTATKLADGRVLIAGGIDGNSRTASAEIFDPANESFTLVSFMNEGRQSHAAVLLNDGRVLVVGGLQAGSGSAETYSPQTGTWSMSNNNLGYRASPAIALLRNGNVLVTGGGHSSRVDLFDTSNNTWFMMTPLLKSRWTHSASTLPSGKVLVAGGNDGFTASYTAEIYDTSANGGTGESTLVSGSLTIGGWNHSAALLLNGNVFLAGGVNFSSPSCSTATVNAQLYNFATNTLSADAPLGTARSVFTMTLLPSGLILDAGGSNLQCGTQNILNSAEFSLP